jgi:hypothetical protein
MRTRKCVSCSVRSAVQCFSGHVSFVTDVYERFSLICGIHQSSDSFYKLIALLYSLILILW